MDRWQPVLRVAFKGSRFTDAALDVDAMPELWAYRTLVTKLAESLWRQEHPESLRLKKGFAAQFRMRCASFEAGSTVAALERSVDGQLTLDGTGDVFDRAMKLVDEVVAAANRATTLPPGFPRDCLALFRAWGKTLGEGESLELRTPDDALRTVYTPASRAYLVGLIETAYEDFADMRGHVLATSLRKGRFELYPDVDTGPGIEVPLSEEHEATVLDALASYQDTLVRVVGRVAYAADGHALRFVSVENIEPWDPEAPVDNGGLWASLARISASVPEQVWARVPEDASQRIDDYLAGE